MPSREPKHVRDSRKFAPLCEMILGRGLPVRFPASGQSMQPNILDGDLVEIAPLLGEKLRRGDIALTRTEDGFVLHRVVECDDAGDAIVTRGDAGLEDDGPSAAVLGRAVAVERGGKRISVGTRGAQMIQALRREALRFARAAASRGVRLRAAFGPLIFVLLAVLLHASPLAAQADLQVTADTAAAPTTVAAGGTITYTITVVNNGPNTANAPVLTDTTPANTTFVSMARTGGTGTWNCANPGVGATGTSTCTRTTNMGNGSTATFTYVVQIIPGTAAGTTITNSAKITSTTTDSNNANNTLASNVVTVGATPDISVGGTAAPNPVATGGTITYTETVTNNSTTVAAAGGTLTQSTPAGTLFNSVTPPAGWTCGTVPPAGGTGSIICTANGNFNASASVNFTLVLNVMVEATGGSAITNTVTVSEIGTDPNSANNTAALSVTVTGADLSMTQVASAAAVAPGSTITYTETVTNNGPSAATTAVLYQQTPPNTTFASMIPPAGWTCGTLPAVGATGQVICTANAAMNSGTTASNFTFVVTVGAATAAGTSIVNSADATSQTTDPVPSNNTTMTSVLVEIAGDADLAVSMTASPTPVFVSSPLSYTIQVTNLGLAAASNVQIVDTLPAGFTSASASSATATCGPPAGGTITCTVASIAYPLASPITITISGTTQGTATTLTNSVTVSTATTDPVSPNNSVTVLTVVQPLVCATPGKDGAVASLTGIVNAYYPPAAGVGTVAAGSKSIALGAAPAGGAQTAIASGDLLLIIQMQNATINATNSSSYGSGVAGDPASGSTSLGSAGLFEYVTATSAVPVTGGTLNFTGTGAGGGLLNTYVNAAAAPATNPTAGQSTFQVIRVPQYTLVTLTSGADGMSWNGATGGVLALDVSGQLTLGGTVALDAQGFRGGAGETYTAATTPPTPLKTDYVTLSTQTTNASKGEGIAGTQRFIANATLTGATNSGNEGYPAGSFARGAPGNAGGGATDADPTINDQNSGGGGGGNGGAGGTGGFGWSSAGVVGGFGGAVFTASTSAIAMGGGAGAGTTNNGSYWNPATDTGGANCGAACTGINSSGAAGGGIVIIHAGSVVGTGSITANGQTALAVENDGGGGGGAGGTIIVFANSGNLVGLTVSAAGGNGGQTWPEQAPGTFPGNRHGPGAGGGGGVVMTSATPAGVNVTGGNPGWSTLANDAYGATPGQPGMMATGLTITQTPGTQSGAYCAGADLAVTNSGTPNPVLPSGNITYTQVASNNGPFDAVNAVFSEVIPANTVFQSLGIAGPASAGWNCTTPSFGGTGSITCTNPDVAAGASGTATFTVVVKVNAGTAAGTQIVDTDSITSGTSDPVLTNNTATVLIIVGAAGTADLTITNSATPNPVLAGNNITYTVVVTNNGPASASTVAFTEAIPANTTLQSVAVTSGTTGWSCTPGVISCSIGTFASGASTTFTVIVKVNAGTAAGTVITDTANVASTTTDPNPSSNEATATVVVAAAGQSDLAITKTGSPNPVLAGNKITYTVVVTNNGPAAIANPVLTDTIPANVSVTTVTPAAGWSCNPPSGGTFTCTIGSLASGASGTFTFVMTVTAGTAPGITITNAVSIGPTANDPNTGNNTASTSSTVASPTQADVAIVKTASPEPVNQGTNLTYTLQVTNNGPAVAEGVVVTDPLPSQVTYTSASTTQGSCSQSGGTVTCNLGSISVGGLVVITINVSAATFSSSSLASNTASVTAATGDPNLTNNSSTATSTIQSPTAVQIVGLRASVQPGGGVVVEWQTRTEVRNLGFHVYREDAQGRLRLDASLIAGSALALRGGLPQHRAKSYQWLDPLGGADASYWIEDVDLNGTRTMHGPVYVDSSAGVKKPVTAAALLRDMNQAIAVSPAPAHVVRLLSTPQPQVPVATSGEAPASLNGVPAVKILVTTEGWYRVSRAQLVAAGLDPNADARTLQLYAEGIEQPMLILGRQIGPLGPTDSIEFYGTSIDTPYSGTRVYWLIRGTRAGKRIAPLVSGGSSTASVPSFPCTVLFEQRTTYFAALLNGEDNDNFFGAIVSTEPVDQSFHVAHIDRYSTLPVTMDVTLQGVTDGQMHQVAVSFNGSPVGEIDFANQANVTNTLPISSTLLQDGTNTVTFTALDGDFDVSLVQSIALHYAHTYTADGNWLRATANSGDTVHIGGFTNSQIHVLDITDPTAIAQLVAPAQFEGSGFGVMLGIRGARGGSHTLLAFTDDQTSSPDALSFHQPSSIDRPQAGADIIVIAHPDFVTSIAPLVKLHQSQGDSVIVVTTDQIFDAFNFGERSPYALRSYLQLASTSWRVHPQAVLLVGGASFDPRNYLGFGYWDFVPSRMIETAAFKTASDDWLTDFKQTGFATIPTGRLPVRTPADAALLVSKIVGYESGASAGSWQQQALVVADQNVDVDFTTSANFAAADMPKALTVTRILANGMDPVVAQQQILAALNGGALLVNYIGHGSEEQWSFSDLLDDSTVAALSNGDRLPVYLLMDCLNGYFHDVYATSLSTALLLAPNGGAVGVWASSGFTDAAPQATMDQALLGALAANPSTPIAKAILGAKLGITDPDVRRTWIFFGDPAMRLPIPAVAPSSTKKH